MAIELDIFGGYACRDTIRHDEKGNYQVERCISGVPITTLYGPSGTISKEKLAASSLSVYEQRMLEVQGLGKAVGLLKRSKANVLLIDLTDELLRRFLIANEKGDFQIAAEEKYAIDIEGIFADGKKTMITQQSPLEMKLPDIEESFKRFAKDITFSEENPGGYKEKNVIVLEAYYTEKIIDNASAMVKDHPKGLDIKKANELLRQLYLMLYRYIPGCNSIKFPEFTHSSENHLRGVTPLSYTENTYHYYLRALDVLFGFDKVNSINNIYNEQNLSNKLFTRVLNASPVYSIEGMKKDIGNLKNELKKQIDEIKKQGVASKPNNAISEEAKKVIAEDQKKNDEAKTKLEKEKKQLEEAKKQLNEAKKQLDEAKKQAEETKNQLAKEKKQSEETKSQLEKEKKQSEETKNQLEKEKKQLEETKKQIEETKKQIEEAKNQTVETKNQNEEIKKQNEEIKKLNEEIKKQTEETKKQIEEIQTQNDLDKKKLEEEKQQLNERIIQFEKGKELLGTSEDEIEKLRQQYEKIEEQNEIVKQQAEEIKMLTAEVQKQKQLAETKHKQAEASQKEDSGVRQEEMNRLSKEHKRATEEIQRLLEANKTLNVENKYLIGVREELNRENNRLSKLVQKILITGPDRDSI